jgi:hypothetical protein
LLTKEAEERRGYKYLGFCSWIFLLSRFN